MIAEHVTLVTETSADAVKAEPILQFFAYAHLPEHLQAVSKPFCGMAYHIVTTIPRNPERTVALRKTLEAKDCAVRAVLMNVDSQAYTEIKTNIPSLMGLNLTMDPVKPVHLIPPAGYVEMPVGVNCRCLHSCATADGRRWCCGRP